MKSTQKRRAVFFQVEMTAGMEHRIETLEANGAKAADAAAQTLSATKAVGEAELN